MYLLINDDIDLVHRILQGMDNDIRVRVSTCDSCGESYEHISKSWSTDHAQTIYMYVYYRLYMVTITQPKQNRTS